MLRCFRVHQMLKLIVGSLVSVVEVSWVQGVRACEGIINFGLLSLRLPDLSSLLVTVDQASLVAVVIIVLIFSFHAVIVTAEMLRVVSTKAVFIDIAGIDFLITLNELVHLLLGIVEASASSSSTFATFISTHLHLLFKHHDLILLVCILVLVVGSHIQPRVR